MKKIAIIVCYFGKFPWYFDLFAKSCGFNRCVDFLLITDHLEEGRFIPANMTVIIKSLEEVSKIAAWKLKLNIRIKEPYKLCDFKPAYGYLFQEWIRDYDYWGYSDMDIIFGDIRAFFTDEVLEAFDIFSVRPEYLTGFFALYRNDEFVTTLFTRSKDYKKVFTADHYCSLDECGGVCMELIAGQELGQLKTEIESMTHVIHSGPVRASLRAYFEFHVAEGLPGELLWDRGKLTYKNRFELILYHLIDFKRQPDLRLPNWKVVPEMFYINHASVSSVED